MPLNPFKQHISPSRSRASDRQNFSGLPARDRCLYLRRPSKGSRLQVWHLCGRSKTKPAPGKERECQGVPGKGGESVQKVLGELRPHSCSVIRKSVGPPTGVAAHSAGSGVAGFAVKGLLVTPTQSLPVPPAWL